MTTTGFAEPDTWQPERLLDVASVGRTSPLVIECSRAAGGKTERETFVVKARGVDSVDDASTFREVAGSLLASGLGVAVPSPAFIDVDDAFVAAVSSLPLVAKRKLVAGRCFGCRHLGRGLEVPGPGTVYDEILRADAARVFGFDLAFQNSDRLPTNPNCVLSGGRVIAFDFERAFEFTWRSGAGVSPLHPAQLWVATRHLFREAIQKDRSPLLQFASDLQSFDVDRLRTAANWMPSSWHLHLKKVVTHIETIQADGETFTNSLIGAAA